MQKHELKNLEDRINNICIELEQKGAADISEQSVKKLLVGRKRLGRLGY